MKGGTMITERTLKRWRQEALILSIDKERCASLGERPVSELLERIIRMTQELLDQHLLKGKD
jgi:hypothetical protein